MRPSPKDCCVLNAGDGAWAFAPLAERLGRVLRIDVSKQPRRFNYLLHVEDPLRDVPANLFISLDAIRLAADKRLLAAVFDLAAVPRPMTQLFDDFGDVLGFVRAHVALQWCLKYPTSCGANGHRLITIDSEEPPNWPRPFVVQKFLPMEKPEVYRTYCAAGEVFGWMVRRFPDGMKPSPWVAHAKGARYASLGEPPEAARAAARMAFAATHLLDSFGCADLLPLSNDEWLVLEVGTDGLYNHVDRELDDPAMEARLDERIAAAFWQAAEKLG